MSLSFGIKTTRDIGDLFAYHGPNMSCIMQTSAHELKCDMAHVHYLAWHGKGCFFMQTS